MMGSKPPKIVVVGGGIAGLTSALELAAHGCDVRLFEGHGRLGGKMRSVDIDGRAIDVGPTVLTMRWVFELLFRDVGCELEDHVRLVRATSVARHAWEDGSSLELYFDEERSREAIRAFAGERDAKGYSAFCRYAKDIYDYAYPSFMISPDPSIRYMARHAGPKAMGTVFHIDPFRKMARAIRSFFRDPRLVQLFSRYATYYGSSPYMAPATLNLIAFVEQQGVWLPVDGMTSVAEAVARLARDRGAELVCNAKVEEIRVEDGGVRGVVLKGGRFEPADAVVYNGDISALGSGALGEAVKGAGAVTKPGERSLAALVGAVVARTEGFSLAPHNVFFHTTAYEQEFVDIFKRRRLPAHPTVYVRAQDRDQGALPEGEPERLFFIINAPPRGDVEPLTHGEIETCIEGAMKLLERSGLSLDGDPKHRRIFSPNDFAARFPGTGGALYGPATHSMWASLKRFGVRGRLPGLYLAGGSVHPGAGVPMAALGGRQAATCLLEDRGLTGPSPLTDIPGGTSTG